MSLAMRRPFDPDAVRSRNGIHLQSDAVIIVGLVAVLVGATTALAIGNRYLAGYLMVILVAGAASFLIAARQHVAVGSDWVQAGDLRSTTIWIHEATAVEAPDWEGGHLEVVVVAGRKRVRITVGDLQRDPQLAAPLTGFVQKLAARQVPVDPEALRRCATVIDPH
jgi:hypothetical protein